MEDKDNLIVELEQFKSGLIAVSTDGSYSDKEYSLLRDKFMQTSSIKNVIPMFIKAYRTPLEFRRFMQTKYSTYADRRQFITEEINKVILYIEEGCDRNSFSNEVLKKLSLIGEGGFGKVFKYHHDILDMEYAIKFFEPFFADEDEQKAGEKRFFREAKILFSLHSDNIVQVYDAGYLDGKPFIRMEYIDGLNLNQLLENYSILPIDKSVTAIKGIIKGISYAHNKGIIHRDLKPSNVMFDTNTKDFKIIDFGISAFMDVDGHTKLTKTGEHIAGGNFIDPELQINPKLRDKRSDIYSIGAIWYFLLTGRAPAGADVEKMLISSAKINENQINVIMKCLSSKIDDRYDSCESLLRDIDLIY